MLRNCTSCVTPCEQYLFEGSLSYAGLSVDSVDRILDRDRSRLQEKFNVAINTGQRTGRDTFTRNIRLARDTDRLYTELLGFVRQYLLIGPNSTIVKLSDAVDVIMDICRTDLDNLFNDLKPLQAIYGLSYRDTIDLVQMELDRLALAAMESRLLLLDRNDQGDIQNLHRSRMGVVGRALDATVMVSKGLGKIHQNFENSTQTAHNLLKQTNGELPYDIAEDELLKFLPTKLYSSTQCEFLDQEMTGLLQTILELYQTFALADASEFEYILLQHDEDLSRNITKFLAIKEQFQTCLDVYETLLQQSQDWLFEAKQGLSGNIGLVEIIQTGLLNQTQGIESNRKATKKTLKEYAENSITTEVFLSRFSDFSQGQNSITVLRSFVESIKSLVTGPLATEINSRIKDLNAKYRTALQKAGNLEIFFKPYYFYDSVSLMDIWKGPLPNINNPAEYSNRGVDLWTIWNRDSGVSLVEFAVTQTSTAESLQNYMQSIKDQLRIFEQQLTSQEQSLIDTLENLERVHIELQNFKKIDSVFVQ